MGGADEHLPGGSQVTFRPDAMHPGQKANLHKTHQLLMSADKVFSISLTTDSGIGM